MRFIFSLVSIMLFASATDAFAQAMHPMSIDGIPCQSEEGAVFHSHQHLAIYDHGKAVTVPAGVGIVDGRCLYWLHTHTPDGIIHIEAPVYRAFTLGEFFDVWKQPLSATRVAGVRAAAGQIRVYVGGNRYRDNPRTILLGLHTDIVIEAGGPYVTPKPFQDWRGN
jgi:hypothetical protein